MKNIARSAIKSVDIQASPDKAFDKKPGADCRLQATGKPVYLTSILTQE